MHTAYKQKNGETEYMTLTVSKSKYHVLIKAGTKELRNIKKDDFPLHINKCHSSLYISSHITYLNARHNIYQTIRLLQHISSNSVKILPQKKIMMPILFTTQ